MLIKQLLTGRKRSDFVIIKDRIDFNGLLVLKKFIEEGNNKNAPVHLILSEYNLTNFNVSPNVVIHRYFTDPWRLLTIDDNQKNFELLIDRIIDGSSHTSPVLIVIDSIASILQYVDLHLLCNCLRKVTSTFIKEGIPAAQVVTVFHSELFSEDSKEFKYLNYIATTEINLKKEHDGISTLDVVYRQLNGKIQKESYCCTYSPTKEPLFEIRKELAKPKKEENNDILVKSTFKLTLEEKEKELKSQVILPYLKNSNVIGKGRIFYEPDVNDDWDDEDPDDDLEI